MIHKEKYHRSILLITLFPFYCLSIILWVLVNSLTYSFFRVTSISFSFANFLVLTFSVSSGSVPLEDFDLLRDFFAFILEFAKEVRCYFWQGLFSSVCQQFIFSFKSVRSLHYLASIFIFIFFLIIQWALVIILLSGLDLANQHFGTF